MDLKDFTDLGNGIGRRVNDAINSMNFDRLSSDIRDEINQAFGKEPEYGGLNGKLYREPIEKKSEWTAGRRKKRTDIYRGNIPIAEKIPGKISGIIGMAAGIALAVFCGVPAVTFGVLGGTLSSVGTITSGMFAAAAAGLMPMTLAGIVLAAVGAKKFNRSRRFKRYLDVMGNEVFYSVKDLAGEIGKSDRFVIKDLEKMIQHRFFLQGHLDDAKTCFIGTDETYVQYAAARDSAVESAREQQCSRVNEKSAQEMEMEQNLEDVIRRGEAYIDTVRKANDAIYNAEISEKLLRMEIVLEKIFDYVRENPSQIGQLRRFMDYYMPITEKLVRAYRDMDSQSIEGENIRKAKSEIAKTLDTINEAYEKLYDSMYSQVAMDVSSDIAVLKTLFAQEGLAGHGIKGEKMSDFNLGEPPVLDLDAAMPTENVQPMKTVEDEYEQYPLSSEEKAQVESFAEKIDLYDSQTVLQYGAGTQKQIADFSEKTLENIKTKDLGAVGQAMTNVIGELKNFSTEEEKKGILGLFKKQVNKAAAMKSKYTAAETNIRSICKVLEDHQVQLMKDSAMLDQMYRLNEYYFKELTMYIIAGKQKLQTAKNTELPQMMEKAKASGRSEDLNAANDYASLIARFEKKIYDLELTRTISLQTAPQIRLVQNNDILMSEKIQSMLVNTVPLWKSQMVLALGIEHSNQAAKAQKAVTDMTNELLMKNAETLKTATAETAQQMERGVVDIETLEHTNELLIATMDEVMQIQEEGRQKRAEAEGKLMNIENQLKQKLMEMNR